MNLNDIFKNNINKAPEWTSLGEALTIADKISIIESYYINGKLLESDDHSVDYFDNLSRLSATPIEGEKYIVTPLMLIQNRVIPLNISLLDLTFVKQLGERLIFVDDNGDTRTFPDKHISERGLTKTFVFDNIESYDQFRSESALKFSVDLPEANDLFEGKGKQTALDRWRAAADERLKQQDKDTAEYERKKGPDFEQEYQKWRKEVHGDRVNEHGGGVNDVDAYIKWRRNANKERGITKEWQDSAPGEPEQTGLRPVEESQHYNSGSMAAVKGQPYSSNPHPKGSQEHLEWSKGHNAMRARRAELDETKGLGKCVEITRGPDAGKIGYVRQIKTDRLRGIKYLDLDLEDGGQTVVKSNEVRIVKDQSVEEGWSGNEPTWVCVNGKKWKLFPTEDHARNVGNKLQAKLRTEGRKDQVSYISTEADIDEGSMASAEHHPTGPEFTGYWKGTDSGTPGNKMVGGCEESKEVPVRNFVAKNAKTAGAGQHKDKKRAQKQGDVKHKKQAIPMDMEEGIAGNMTARSTPLTLRTPKVVTPKLPGGKHSNALKKAQAKQVSENFMEWAVKQEQYKNFIKDPAVYAAAKNEYNSLVESLKTDNPCWKGYHPVGTKEKNGRTVPNCVPTNEEELDEMGAELTSHGGLGALLKDHAVPIMAFAAVAASVGIQRATELLQKSESKFAKFAHKAVKSLDKNVIHNMASKIHNLGVQALEEDWQKANRKDKTDGMSKKAVKAYRREHPGSKLQTAVTTKPSKLKKGSKAAKRRKSFCARMSGVKGPMKDKHGKPTAKAKALRRWNCESQEQFDSMLHEALDKGTLKPGQYYIWTVFFDDDTNKRIKVTKDNFDPKAYYAKQNKNVINIDFDWTVHNG